MGERTLDLPVICEASGPGWKCSNPATGKLCSSHRNQKARRGLPLLPVKARGEKRGVGVQVYVQPEVRAAITRRRGHQSESEWVLEAIRRRLESGT